MAFLKCKQHLEIFSEILVMLVKLQFAVSRASLIFQKRFAVQVHEYHSYFRKDFQMLLAHKKVEI